VLVVFAEKVAVVAAVTVVVVATVVRLTPELTVENWVTLVVAVDVEMRFEVAAVVPVTVEEIV
jgi:hypothetical protein